MNITNKYDPFLHKGLEFQNKFKKLESLSATKSKSDKEALNFQHLIHEKKSTSKIPNSVPSSSMNTIPNKDDIFKHIAGDKARLSLYEASKEFESFFVEKMYTEMKKNIPKTGFINGGFAEEIFDEMLLTERVKKISNHTNLGLAEMIYKQLQQSTRPMDYFA